MMMKKSSQQQDVSEEDRVIIGATFQIVQPICQNLVPTPLNTSHLKELLETLNDLNPKGVQRCMDYIFFPLRKHLSSGVLQTQQKELIFECIEKVLLKVKISDENSFCDLFQTILFSLGGVGGAIAAPNKEIERDEKTTKSFQEGLCHSTLKTLHALLKSSSFSQNHPLTLEKQFPTVAFCITCLLDIASFIQAQRSIRSYAILVLGDLIWLIYSGKFGFSSFLDEKKDFWTFFGRLETVKPVGKEIVCKLLPGIASALGKLVGGDYKHGTHLKVTALKVWTLVIVIALSDPPKKTNEKNTPKNQDSSWIITASSHIHKLVSIMFPIPNICIPSQTMVSSLKQNTVISHTFVAQKWKMRLAMVESAYLLCKFCRATLSSCLPLFLDLLILHTSDEQNSISFLARKFILEIFNDDDNNNNNNNNNSNNNNNNNNNSDSVLTTEMASTMLQNLLKPTKKVEPKQTLLEIIETNFQQLIVSLPRLVREALVDEEKLLSLKILRGYIFVLGNKIKRILEVIGDKFALSFIQVLELDVYDLRLKNSMTTEIVFPLNSSQTLPPIYQNEDTPITPPSSYLQKIFKHFRSEEIQRTVISLCRLLGKKADIFMLVDLFMGFITQNQTTDMSAAILVVNEIILGASNIGVEEWEINTKMKETENKTNLVSLSLINSILDEYFSTEVWNLSINERVESKNKSIEKANRNFMIVSLLLEGIGNLATILNKSDYNENDKLDFIQKSLYPLLEKLGEQNPLVSQSAWTTLHKLAELNGVSQTEMPSKKITQLISQNADYLVDSIGYRMRYLENFPSTPKVFHGILEFTGTGFLPLLDDTIELVLSSVDTFCNNDYVEIFFKILTSVLKVLYRIAIVEIENRRKELKEPKKNKVLSENDEKTKVEFNDIKDFFVQHHKEKKEKEEMGIDGYELENEQDEKKNNNSLAEGEYKTALTVKQRVFSRKIISKSIHFIASNSRNLRILVLELLRFGLVVISTSGEKYADSERDGESSSKISVDENILRVPLLPVVHSIWIPLIRRVNDKDKIVAVKAIEIITELSRECGDFLASKFIQDLWPNFKRLVQEETVSQEKSKNSQPNKKQVQFSLITKEKQQGYQYTLSFRIQKAILECVIEMSRNITFPHALLMEIMITFLGYLSDTHFEELQFLAIKLYQNLSIMDSDTLWLFACEISRFEFPSPPHNSFSHIKNVKWGTLVGNHIQIGEENHYLKNGRDLLDFIEKLSINVG